MTVFLNAVNPRESQHTSETLAPDSLRIAAMQVSCMPCSGCLKKIQFVAIVSPNRRKQRHTSDLSHILGDNAKATLREPSVTTKTSNGRSYAGARIGRDISISPSGGTGETFGSSASTVSMKK